ncbi:hypothetical protein ACFLU6_13625 [Acidobacteriota bacterium]
MALKRTHVLLEPEQQKALAEIASREGRSVSEVTRELLQHAIAKRQKQLSAEKKRRLLALENARHVRESLDKDLHRKGAKIVELIKQMREERDAQVLGSGG